MATSLSLVVLRVLDLGLSAEFYGRLGLSLTSEQHGDGPKHLSAQIGETVLELYPIGEGVSSVGIRLGFEVNDLRAVLARIDASAHVGTFDRDGDSGAVVRDPDGHKIELVQNRPGAMSRHDGA
jgi:catechol 2,3-dioxygenase-like lactoylglutathione lyase family enzyme